VRARVVDREEVSIPIGDSDTGSVHVECRTFVSFDFSRLANGRGSVVAIGRLLLIAGETPTCSRRIPSLISVRVPAAMDVTWSAPRRSLTTEARAGPRRFGLAA
jgi:hypothetical protein